MSADAAPAAALAAVSLDAAPFASEPRDLRVGWLNVDGNNQFNRGPLYTHLPAFGIMERMPEILKWIKFMIDSGVDVLGVLELRIFTNADGQTVNPVAPIVQLLDQLGFAHVITQYNPDPGAFMYLLGFRRTRFAVRSTNSFYVNREGVHPIRRLGRKPEVIKLDGFGDEFGRSVFVARLFERDSEVTHTVCMFHPAFSLEHRLATARILKWICQEEHTHVIAFGDYNTFKDDGGQQQIDSTLEGGKLVHATVRIVDLYGEEMDTTFFNFPYDFGPNASKVPKQAEIAARDDAVEYLCKLYEEHNPGKGSVLDHAFCTPDYKVVSAKAPIVNFPDMKQRVLRMLREFRQPLCASDHVPVIVHFQYSVLKFPAPQ